VTAAPQSVPNRSEHPDPGRIAAHAERRLSGEEAAGVDAHLASCSTCHEVFAETVRFVLAEEGEEALTGPSPMRLARRRVFKVAAGLAAAAGLVLAVHQAWRARPERAALPLVAELAEAMGTRRFIEPRVTGGFRHGRLVILRSGDASQGLDAQPPAVLAAVARIRERVSGDTSPAALGALAVTYLVSGDVGGAVEALESATAQDPKSARLQSDLAAAYLVRASRLDAPADLPKALEAAGKAIELGDPPDEAWFNRALALESLHLVDAARKAWQDFLERDSTSGWADEARKHLEELPLAQQSSIEDDRARARAALSEGRAAVERLADESPPILREYFDHELLPAWAEAHLAGQPNAVVLRGHVRLLGEALLRATGDAMPRDAALALETPRSDPSRDPSRTQALGFQALSSAQRSYDLQQPACDSFRKARSLLESGGSPYAAWARERVVTACLYPAGSKAGLAELRRIDATARDGRYTQLLGLVRWREGLFLWHAGDLDTTLELYRLARASFHSVRDQEREALACGGLAESFHMAGEHAAAWAARREALALLAQVRDPRRRHDILEEAALACLDESLPRSGHEFQTAVVEAATRWSNALAITDAFVRRAQTRHALGSFDSAASDLAEARRTIPRIGDASRARRQEAEADAAEGELLARRQPERAVALLERAVDYFDAQSPVRVPELRLSLGRTQASLGHDAEAESEIQAGIESLESQRTSFQDQALQASFFDRAAPLFDDMVDLQVERRRDPDRGLLFVERGRARQLADSLARGRPPEADRAAAAMPLEPASLQTELPDGVVLLYYAPRDDHLLAWALTREECRFAVRPLPAAELGRLVAAYDAAVERRAPPPEVRERGARLYDELVRPLVSMLRPQRSLVVVPEGIVQSVAFASLWDRRAGRYLVEDYLVGLAPSGTVFARATRAAAEAPRGRTPTVLVVGNPRLGRGLELLSLPGAEAEAEEIAGLYRRSVLLTGREATKPEFLGRLPDSQIVHFTGHALSGTTAGAARLLFSADPRGRDSGVLYLRDLDGRDFRGTQLVVLAACRTAKGPLSRLEGALSLARPFLAAGVPRVVASLWDIDDAVSRSFFVGFHRTLLEDGDPLVALRRTQIALLRQWDPWLAHPASWAAFVHLGGVDPRLPARVSPRDPVRPPA
jgi:CHAT domain-containing protein/tetratricopeptide (TPR) repeat protein